ncbi:MAG: 5-formyltetrahydrofolate cyclo-ligase [Melioribacteraceae bacterium]|nr:5-formyltetrahydrofolate cyclo-ligase [Melioribacteraceae bacterium]
MSVKPRIPKSEARKTVIERAGEISRSDLHKKTIRIYDKFLNSDDFKYANTIHCYIGSKGREVDTRHLIDRMKSWGKSVILPKLNLKTKKFLRFPFSSWNDIEVNASGYYEPRLATEGDMNDIDLMIVPCTAVSKRGERIGNGGGYYDNLLREVHCSKIVLAYEYQLFDAIESDTADIKIDKIITEHRILTINSDIN